MLLEEQHFKQDWVELSFDRPSSDCILITRCVLFNESALGYIPHSDFTFLQIGLLVEGGGEKFCFYPTLPEGISVGLCVWGVRGRRRRRGGGGGSSCSNFNQIFFFCLQHSASFSSSPHPHPSFPLELSSSRLSASVSPLFLSISLCHCQYSQWRTAVFFYYPKVELLLGYDY